MEKKLDAKFLFKVPQQTLENLSYSGHTPKKLSAWVDSLPRANLGETARMLYAGVQELNQLVIDSGLRFKLLEILRPAIYYVCRSLEKHYLNQPVILPEKSAKTANLAQALQTHLANGYKIVIVYNVNRIEFSDAAKIVSKAIHRAICDLTSTLYRCYQLYFPTANSLWMELNTLYFLAEKNGLLDGVSADSETSGQESLSISEVYRRACLLSVANPNQLRQKEIRLVYEASATWAKYIELSSDRDNGQSFLVNLLVGQEPRHFSLLQKESEQQYRYFDCSHLVNHLEDATQDLESVAGTDFESVSTMPPECLQQIVKSWNAHRERSFNRTAQKGALFISVGMSSVHYYLSGDIEFDDLISGKHQHDEDIEMNQTPDNSTANFGDEGSITPGYGSFDKDSDKTSRYVTSRCELVNTSAGGYCINLPSNLPSLIKSGEMLVLKEREDSKWNLGVIRWVKRFSKEVVRIGIELLAAHVIPIGVKIVQNTGDTMDYMRALLLPEVKAIGQSMSVITPNVAFVENAKIMLNQGGEEVKGQLLELTTRTASYSHFELKLLSENKKFNMAIGQDDSSRGDDEFDSIWSSL